MCRVELEILSDTKPAFLAHSHVHQSDGTLYYLAPVPDNKDLVTENKVDEDHHFLNNER